MDDQKWERLTFLIEQRCKILLHRKEGFEIAKTSTGQPIMAEREFIEFESPLGKMKLEKILKPKVIDKKVLSSKRIGGRVAVDYVYSSEEFVSEIKIYCWDNQKESWQEADLKSFNL
jgi:hypothetical protein